MLSQAYFKKHWLDCGLRGNIVRSSLLQMFLKIGFLKISQFTGKHSCWSFFLIKLKKRLQHMCFPVNIAKFLKTFFSQNTSSGCFCIVQVIVWRNIGPSRPSQHCVDCFPAKTCLCALGQHCTSSALVQRSFRRIRQHCTGKNLV